MDKVRATSRSLSEADEQVDKGRVHIEAVRLGDFKVKRQTYPAGWRFSTDMGQAQCYDTHVGYAISGTCTSSSAAGRSSTSAAATCSSYPPGHDAWTVGEEDA